MQSGFRVRRYSAVLALSLGLVWMGSGCSSGEGEQLSASDLAGIRAADQAYADAWLANDPEQVMATLTPDAVMIPSGMAALDGPEAIRGFWFPEDSPPTVVNAFSLDQHEVGGDGDIGFVRGQFSLEFDYDGNAYTGRGRYLSLMRRDPDGTWRISHRMWSDIPRDVD